MGKLLGAIDRFLMYLSEFSGEPATTFCELETVDADNQSMIAADGSMATVIKLVGSARMRSIEDHKELVRTLSATLETYLETPGHSLQVYFMVDPDGAAELIRKTVEPSRLQARKMELAFDDLFDERERELTKWVAHEKGALVCWTHPAILTPSETKDARATQAASNKQYDALRFGDGQNLRRTLAALRNRHSSYVASVEQCLKEQGLIVQVQDGHSAIKEIRESVDPSFTSRGFKAVLPGDRIPVRFPMRADDHAAVWWPSLKAQVWPRDAVTIGTRYVEIGDRVHAPMYIDMPPRTPLAFDRLMTRINGLDAKMPWSVSFLLKGGGMRGVALKKSLSEVLAVFSSDNPLIRDSLRTLSTFALRRAVPSLQVSFNTWAPAGELPTLRARAARLAQAMIDWGGATVREATGDPLEGFTSTALGLTQRSVAVAAPQPVVDAAYILPLIRPASPWTEGVELFTSPDRKLMPFQPGSPLQATHIGIYVGGPGSGKSMQMFKQHLATCLAPQPGTNLLPLIGIVDIGPSASGLYSLLYNALPAKWRHHVNYTRVRNVPEQSNNPFDLQLGCERPLPEERSAQVNLLTMIFTPPETLTPIEGTGELAGLIVDLMYDACANDERGKPKRYSPGVDKVVDERLAALGVRVDAATSWYEVRDLLFKAGDTHAATLAQRYGVPLLGDAINALRANQVRDVYGKKLVAGPGSESLPEALSRMVQAATREYQVFTRPTRLDLGESRVTILDLDEVAKPGSPVAEKQTAVMYALAIFTLGRSYTLTDDNLKDMPELYRAYHFKRVQRNARELKTLCFDEFHRTNLGFSKQLRRAVQVYASEGRKWAIQLMLGSQRLEHFDDDIIDMATAVFLMEAPSASQLETYSKRFGLTETEKQALLTGVKQPRAGGGTFFARMKVTSVQGGAYVQLLRNPAGPLELWAGGTTPADKGIRALVYQQLGAVEGRLALAMSYPSGSAKDDVEARKVERTLRGGDASGDNSDDVYAEIAKEVIDLYQRRRAEALGDVFAKRRGDAGGE